MPTPRSSKNNRDTAKIRQSLEYLVKRFGSKRRIIFFGMLQGAGAVIGATLIVLVISWILNLLGTFEPISDDISTIRDTLHNARKSN